MGTLTRLAFAGILLALLPLAPSSNANVLLADLPKTVLDDPEGNVQYDPLYPGSHDHEYIDITEVSIRYDETRDEITVLLYTVGFEEFKARTTESSLSYEVWGDFAIEDEPVGRFVFNYTTSLHELFSPNEEGARVRFCDGTGLLDCVDVPEANFTMEQATPGVMTWTLPRARFAWYGESMVNFQSSTVESYSPQAMFNVPIRNVNPIAKGNDVFDLKPLEPTSIGEDDDPMSATASADETQPNGSEAKAGTLGAVAALACVLLAVVGVRTRRR